MTVKQHENLHYLGTCRTRIRWSSQKKNNLFVFFLLFIFTDTKHQPQVDSLYKLFISLDNVTTFLQSADSVTAVIYSQCCGFPASWRLQWISTNAEPNVRQRVRKEDRLLIYMLVFCSVRLMPITVPRRGLFVKCVNHLLYLLYFMY